MPASELLRAGHLSAMSVALLFSSSVRADEQPVPRHDDVLVEQVAEIYRFAQDRDRALQNLEYLSDHIGHRLSGSKSLEQAVEWTSREMAAGGLVVETHPVQVPHWERGEESATLLDPVARDLEILGLGMTVGGTVEGEVVVLTSFDDLETTDVDGRIVLFDVPFTTYGETVQYRVHGASRAAAAGAIGMLLRSVGSASLNTPHTGMLIYDEEQPKIPAAALTLEEASWLHRLYDDGIPLRLRLSLGAEHHGMVTSHNVIAELPGSENPNEAVLVGCHLDSWDVGQGAQDDGSGCMIAWEAAQIIQELGLTPRRTIRVVLFTAEENGIWGGKAYAEERFGDRMLVAALESDTGNGRADTLGLDLSGFSEDHHEAIEARVAEMAAALKGAGVMAIEPGYSGADIGPSVGRGVVGFGLHHDTETYWPIHHTAADTFDKVVPEDLAHNVGVMAAAVYYLAQSEALMVEEKRRGRRRR